MGAYPRYSRSIEALLIIDKEYAYQPSSKRIGQQVRMCLFVLALTKKTVAFHFFAVHIETNSMIMLVDCGKNRNLLPPANKGKLRSCGYVKPKMENKNRRHVFG